MRHTRWEVAIQVELPTTRHIPQLKACLDCLEDSLFEDGVLVAFEAMQSSSSDHARRYVLRIDPGQGLGRIEKGLNDLTAKLSESGIDLEFWIESFGPPRVCQRRWEGQ